MHALPSTPAALAACLDLRAVHVVALAHPDADIVAAARVREFELAAAHDDKDKGKLPAALVTAFRAAYRANLNADATTAALEDGTVLPATDPNVARLLADPTTNAVDRKTLYAAKSTIGYPANVAVLHKVREEAAVATAGSSTTWAHTQAEPFGGLDAIRARLDVYEATMLPVLQSELAELRAAAGLSADADIPIWEARALMARVSATKSKTEASALPLPLPVTHALAALKTLLLWLGADAVDTRVETWARIPFTVWTVTRGGCRGEVWLDLYDRPAGHNKPLRGITSRFRTRTDAGTGGAYVSVRLPADASAMTWAQFTTLAHELGHGVHECLTPGRDEDAQHWAEVPSTLLEHLVATPAVAARLGIGAYMGAATAWPGHQALKDIAVARYAIDLFSTAAEADVPALTGLLPGYTADGLNLHEETCTPALVTLQSAYHLYIMCDAVVAHVVDAVAAQVVGGGAEGGAAGALWAFLTQDDLGFVSAPP